MFHARPPERKKQEEIFKLLRLPDVGKLPKKIKKDDDVVIQLKNFVTFFQGHYL